MYNALGRGSSQIIVVELHGWLETRFIQSQPASSQDSLFRDEATRHRAEVKAPLSVRFGLQLDALQRWIGKEERRLHPGWAACLKRS
jgi:hypothetical protein